MYIYTRTYIYVYVYHTECAARKQARLDSGADVVVGVNKFPPPAGEKAPDALRIDNVAVRLSQVKMIGLFCKRVL